MYFCPCCGYRTFDESTPGSYLVCPICFWEDTGEIDELRQAQLNFLNYGACDRKWLEQVHEPREQEEHNSHWQLLDEQIKAAGAKVIHQINTAFKNVKRGNGISLHEAREISFIIDDYRSIDSLESEALLALARTRDVDTCWQEIPSSCLEKFCDYSSGIWYYYLDSQGWRYYFPAFMVQSIRQYLDYDVIYDLDYVVDRLFPPKKHEVLDRTNKVFRTISRSEYLALITAEQLAAIYQFLEFMINYAKEDYTRERAKETMQEWQKANQQID